MYAFNNINNFNPNLHQVSNEDNKQEIINELFNNINIILKTNKSKNTELFKEQFIETLNKCCDNEKSAIMFGSPKDTYEAYEKIINLLISCSKINKSMCFQIEKYFKELVNYNHGRVYSFIKPLKEFNNNFKNNFKDIEQKPIEKVDKKIKKKIPAALRNKVWNINISSEKKIGQCYVCESKLQFDNFHCGHVISDKNGGEITLDNLKPVCMLCNTSMSSMNMNEFIDTYGFKKNNYIFDKNSKIGDVVQKLNKQERKKIINILYENKLVSLSDLLI